MRYTPFESMDRMFDQMRRDVLELRESVGDWPEGQHVWPRHGVTFDLTEHDDEYVLTIDIPGFETEEIDLVLDGDHLAVSAAHDTPDGDDSRVRTISERITVPQGVVEEDVSASYRNGVLEVRLPVAPDAEERGHRIDVN